MKKIFVFCLALVALAGVAMAEIDQARISVTVPTISTNTGTVTIKGKILSVRFDTAANKTNDWALTTAEGETILAKTGLTTDTTFFPRAATHINSSGAAATFNTYNITNVTAGAAVAVANAWYDKIAVASTLTLTITPAADTTGTNTHVAIITYEK